MASTKQRDIMDSNPRTANNDKLPKIGELFNQIKLGKDFKQLRLIGGFASYAVHWIDIKGSKSGKDVTIPKVCLNYNAETDTTDENDCPYCKIGLKAPVKYLFNTIDRDEQEDLGKKEPKYSKSEIKSKKLESGSKAKTPIFVLQLPPGQVDRLKKYSKLNKVKGDKKKGNFEASVTDPKYGIDLNISFDKDAKGNNYDIQKAERTPLSSRESELLLWDIESIIKLYAPKSLEEAKAEFKELKKVMIDAPDSDDKEYSKDDSKKSKKGKKSKKDDSDISDSDISDSDASDSDSDKKKSKKSSKKSSKKNSSDNSDSDNSDNDLSSDVDSDTSDSDSDSDKKKKSKKSKKDDSDNSDVSDASDSDASDSDASDSDASDSDNSDSDSDSSSKKKGKKSSKKSDASDNSDSDASDVDSDASDSSDSDSDSDKKKKSSKKSSKKSGKKKK